MKLLLLLLALCLWPHTSNAQGGQPIASASQTITLQVLRPVTVISDSMMGQLSDMAFAELEKRGGTSAIFAKVSGRGFLFGMLSSDGSKTRPYSNDVFRRDSLGIGKKRLVVTREGPDTVVITIIGDGG